MYVYVCLCVCKYVCECMYACIYASMNVRMYIHMCANCVHINIHILHVTIQVLFFMYRIPRHYILRNNFSALIKFVDRTKISSATGKVNNNINKGFRVKIYETESGITYPLLLLLLYFNNCYIIILF